MTYAAAPFSARAFLCALALAVAGFVALWLTRAPAPELPFAGDGGEVHAERSYGALPLAFEANVGRMPADVDFISRSASGTVFLDSEGATLAFGTGKRAETIGLELTGATAAEPRALERLPGVVNDLRGDDPRRWRTEIPTFERVRYPNVWPGIDLDWYGNQHRLEYDLRLAPGADPRQMAFRVSGADRLRVAPNGDLVIKVGTETIRQRAPIAYQPPRSDDARTSVRADFTLSGDTVRFRVGPYDERRPLIVDPLVLAYSTYLGGDGLDAAETIAVDSSGAAYVTGFTRSTDFDTVSPIEGDSPGADEFAGTDVFVSKLTPSGDALEYSTYLGGGNSDAGSAIAVDAAGAAYVTGSTLSSDFDTVDAIEGDQDAGLFDVFVAKLTPSGTALDYSTYLGGSDHDQGFGIAVASSGAALVTGLTRSGDFNTENAFDDDFSPGGGGGDAFVAKLTPAGSEVAYSTYLGGSSGEAGHAIAVDGSGDAYVTGETGSTDFPTVGAIEGNSAAGDVFLTKLVRDGNALEYSTYLGGDRADSAQAIAVDSSGAAYLTGWTNSRDFDLAGAIEGNSAFVDAFVSKLTPAGDALAYSTYLGGNDTDEAHGIVVDASGAAYVAGFTFSTDFNTVGAIEGDSANADAFASKLTPSGDALAYSTYLGGGGIDLGSGIAVRPSGAAYITGRTGSTDFDTVGPIDGDSANTDAFVSKLTFCTITGTPGSDTLLGTAGADTICGLGGDDTIVGRRGDDDLLGGDGNDVLTGSRGDDALDGGPGQDRASYYADATGGVQANLATGVVSAANLGIDTILKADGLSTVEWADGSRFDDTLIGDGQDNQLNGLDGGDTIIAAGGTDVLIGARGADELFGGRGNDRLGPGPGDDPIVSGGRSSDTLRYVNVSGGGVAVDLAAGTAAPLGGSDSGTDSLASDIENVVGSVAHDGLSAQLAGIASSLEGGDGSDALDTSDGDALDSAKGGAGADDCMTDEGDARSSCP